MRSGRPRLDWHHRTQQAMGSVQAPFALAFEEHPCVSTPISASSAEKKDVVGAKMEKSFGMFPVIPVLMPP